MIRRIRDIIISEDPPLDKQSLWVKPNDKSVHHDKVFYKFFHYVNGDWREVISSFGPDISKEKQKYWDNKQDKLIPGSGIKIVNNVISTTGGGGGGGVSYLFEDGINGFRVTPEGSDTQFVEVTPNIEGLDDKLNLLQNQTELLSKNPEIKLELTPSIIEKGKNTQVKISVGFYDRNDRLLQADKIDMYFLGSLIVSKENIYTITTTRNATVSGDVRAEVSMYNLKFYKTVKLTALNYILYGFCNASEIPSNKLSLRTSAIATYEDTATSDNQVFKIYIPNNVTTIPSKFTMNGAPAVFNEGEYVDVVNNVTYKTFTSDANYNIGAKLTIKAE